MLLVMSHGMNGSLKGNDGFSLPVNDFLHQFTQSVPEQVPMVGHQIAVCSANTILMARGVLYQNLI